MQETRVNKTQAVKLKAAGFDWEESHIWHNHLTQGWIEDDHNDFYPNSCLHSWEYARPTLSRVCDWMREVKGWHVYSEPIWYGQRYWVGNVVGLPVFSLFQTDNCPTHDLALSAGIDEVLEILEKEVENEK